MNQTGRCPWCWNTPNDCPSSKRTHSATQWPKREEYIKVWLVCEGRGSPHSLNSSWTLFEPPLYQGETKTEREKQRLGGRDTRPPFHSCTRLPDDRGGGREKKRGRKTQPSLTVLCFPFSTFRGSFPLSMLLRNASATEALWEVREEEGLSSCWHFSETLTTLFTWGPLDYSCPFLVLSSCSLVCLLMFPLRQCGLSQAASSSSSSCVVCVRECVCRLGRGRGTLYWVKCCSGDLVLCVPSLLVVSLLLSYTLHEDSVWCSLVFMGYSWDSGDRVHWKSPGLLGGL